jgi:hypothetical protein
MQVTLWKFVVKDAGLQSQSRPAPMRRLLSHLNSDLSKTILTSHLMPPKFRFKDKGKGKSPSSTPSLANGQSSKSSAYEQTRDNLIMASKVIKAISKATNLLKPLKAACQVLRLALETTQVCASRQSCQGDVQSHCI